jgi:hypothetical protein
MPELGSSGAPGATRWFQMLIDENNRWSCVFAAIASARRAAVRRAWPPGSAAIASARRAAVRRAWPAPVPGAPRSTDAADRTCGLGGAKTTG